MNTTELQKFGWLMGSIISVLFGLVFPWIFGHEIPKTPFIIGGAFIFVGSLFPQLLGPVYKIWMKVGEVLGWFNSRILLGIIFFFIFVPMGLLIRLKGRDRLHLKENKDSESYRTSIDSSVRINNMEVPY